LSLWSAPALLLHVISSRGRAGQLEWLPVLRSAVGFFVLSSLSSHDVREFVGSVSVAILVWGSGAFLLIGRRSRRWEPRDSWLAAALALSVAVVLFPNQVSGGSFIKLRIQMLPYLAVLLWIGIEAKRRQTWSWLARALALASVLMIGVRFPAYRKLSREVTEYGTAVAAIAPGSSVLPVTIGTPSNSLRVDVLKHAVDRFSAERGILDLGNYQVLESYFPLHARREFESGLWHAYPLMTHCNHRAWAQLPLVPDYVILTVRQAVASAVAGRSEDARKEIACELRRGTPPYPEVARALGGALRVYRLK
ncbi:MAG TPA: hypothetical protein VMK12_12370, partial [Anaeromyxobacteraceae bacterium]|nr:hypothetical protein [Anaeromyxobacteraceae bacterium]